MPSHERREKGHRQDDVRLPPISQIFNMPSSTINETGVALPPLRHDGMGYNTGDLTAYNSGSRTLEMNAYPPNTRQYAQRYPNADYQYSGASLSPHPSANTTPRVDSRNNIAYNDTRTSWSHVGPGMSAGYPRQAPNFAAYPSSTQGPCAKAGDHTGRDAPFPENTQPDDHSSKTKYECTYCRKGFLRPSALKIHLISHTGDKDFVCPEESCRRRFGVRSNMLRHIRLVHQSLQPSMGEEPDMN